MNSYDKMIFDGKFEEIESLIKAKIITLEDLSEEAFQLFKTWIESPKK
jgi:hypothetical protein